MDEQKWGICPTGSRYEVVRMDGAVARVQKRLNGGVLDCGALFGWLKHTGEVRKKKRN